MVFHYIEYFENRFKEYLEQVLRDDATANNITLGGFNPEISVSIHDEFSYNNDADIDITIKRLTAQFSNQKFVYAPYLIEVKCSSDLLEITRLTLDLLATGLNETMGVDDESNVARQTYDLPTVLQSFINDGIEDKTMLTMNAALFYGEDVQVGASYEIKLGSDANWTPIYVVSPAHSNEYNVSARVTNDGIIGFCEGKNQTGSIAIAFEDNTLCNTLMDVAIGRTTLDTMHLRIYIGSYNREIANLTVTNVSARMEDVTRQFILAIQFMVTKDTTFSAIIL